MENQTVLDNVLYLHQNKLGYKYTTDLTTGFHYLELKTNTYEKSRVLEQNAIVFILEGRCSFSYDQYINRAFSAGNMLFFPKSAMITGMVLEDAKIVYMTFDLPLNPHDKQYIQQLSSHAKTITYDFAPLKINHPMNALTTSLVYLINNGCSCEDLHEVKHKEIFLILRLFYSKEQLAEFFHPIIGGSFNFKNFILENYRKCHKLTELVELSNMHSNVFMRKFKTEFGISAYQWMLKQMCRRIQHKASEPGITIKDIMFEVGIESYSHFNRVCKRHFKQTPRELIAFCQSDI